MTVAQFLVDLNFTSTSVSYTHLDVYKRQRVTNVFNKTVDEPFQTLCTNCKIENYINYDLLSVKVISKT